MKISFFLLSQIYAFNPRSDGKFQLKAADNLRWSNQCITLQTFHKPGGFNVISKQYETTLPAAVLTDCDDSNENQWFEYDVSLQLKANNKCLSFGQFSPDHPDDCFLDETEQISAQLYTTDCISINNFAQKFVFRDGNLRTLCDHNYSLSAVAGLNDPIYENLSEFVTAPLVFAGSGNTRNLQALEGLEVAFEVEANHKGSTMADILYYFIGENEVGKHGCYCSVMDDANHEYATNGKTIDDLDYICRRWWESKHCTSLAAGSCQGVETFAGKNFTFSSSGCANIDSCQNDHCMIDEFYARQIKEFLELNENHEIEIIDQTQQCLKSNIIAGANECSGSAPNLEIIRL